MHLNQFSDTARTAGHDQNRRVREPLLPALPTWALPTEPDIAYVSRNIVARHQRFHFLRVGPAPITPTVLLLHGGNQSAHSWDLVSLALADRYHVLALDQRGHGDSEWARDADYSSGAMAADAAAFCAAVGVDRSRHHGPFPWAA